ncbi:HupE/UreJ family protein [Niveibacterium terrae]|uniref:HupE/UreJ family protein n=1 Tax=Niveibacterium terrae TaxID=3373598 RepID=UPI003A90C2DD
MRRTIALSALIPLAASAHVGADAGLHQGPAFLIGLIHPFTGLDHLAAMLMVGLWSVLAFTDERRAVWAAPAAFASLLLVGGLLGVAGIALHVVETMIALSLLALGAMVGLRVKLPVLAGCVAVGAFAVFHGIAHGNELPAARAAAALSGMVIGTASLHLTGMALGWAIARSVILPRLVGLCVALFGLSLLAG